jgi:hydrogenase-4 component E
VSPSQIDVVAAAAAVIAIFMCGLTRVHNLLWALALQTGLLAAIAALHGWQSDPGSVPPLALQTNASQALTLAGVILGVKALAIPGFLDWTAHRIGIRQDAGAVLSPTLALLAGTGALALGYFLAPQVAGSASQHPGAAGMALTLLFVGMLLMLTRRLAISQVIGFLVLENGIFLYGLTQTHGIPLVVELGVVLDVLVGVMVAGLVIFRLNRSFEHIDVTQLRGLRE